MKPLWLTGLLGCLCAAALAPTAGATIGVGSGDTCIAKGTGRVYTLVITVPTTATSGQAGFAFGAAGVSIQRVSVVGTPMTSGSMSTSNLPANTTAAWSMTSPGLQPGDTANASLTTSGPVSGSFTVVPADSSGSTYLDPITCQVVKTPPPTNTFTVVQHVSYSAGLGLWHLVVRIPGAGVITAKQLEPTVGTQAPIGKTAKAFVQVRSKGLKSSGNVTLSLKPTATGLAKLRASGSMTVKLAITFTPSGGKAATHTVRLTLKK